MHILLVVMKDRRAVIDHLYTSIRACNSSCEVLRLSGEEQENLSDYFSKHVNTKTYDRIIFMLRSKKMFAQPLFFQNLENLVFLEYDACQNYTNVKNKGKFSRFYSYAPWARIIVSGHIVAERLRNEGFDAVFIPKGYDDLQLRNLRKERTVEFGFIGSTNNSIYTTRVAHLAQIAQRFPIETARTNTAEEYLLKLNSFRFFVSADIGFNEYMLKNFEAMACGCVVFAYNHGACENEALGFKDMENIVLYQDINEFALKYEKLRRDPELYLRIANAGQALVEAHNSFTVLGAKIVEALRPPLRARQAFRPVVPSWRERFVSFFRR